jgi:hypothetical protein
LLTLFPPATGKVRAKGVTQATNAVLPPWLKQEWQEILAAAPPVLAPEAPLRQWETWGWDRRTAARMGG